MKQRTLELRQIYKEGTEYLLDREIPDAQIDAWYLLEYVTGISRASYLGDPSRSISETDVEKYFTYIHRRGERVPLQHITGSQEFMGYEFNVNEHVLIPRQDTEVLVEEALKVLIPGMNILDMCTGSGCILISLLKMGTEKKKLPDLKGTGVDVSEEALQVAMKNSKRLGTSATWLQSDLFTNITGTFDLIISNPPYIRTEVIQSLQDEVKLHDPYIALDGREDGLYFYRQIIQESVRYLSEGGYLMFEIGHDQGEAVSELMEHAGYTEVSVKKDLAGLDRVVRGMYNSKSCR